MTQKNTLFDLTTNLLKSPSTFKFTDFITVYNHIYQHCTSPSLRYEIKGREIYNTLLDIINSFTSKIVHYENIQDLHSILHNYETAILLLKKVYHYLERFFITVSIDKRDGYVMDIKTLCYTSIYHNYIEKTELKIFELLIFEIDNFKSTKSEKIEYVRHVIEILKKVYTSNDEDRKFKNFVKSYISNISNKIRNKNSLQDSMDYLFKKIKLTNMIFDRYFVVNIRKKLIKSIIKRKNELIELVIERIMTDSNVKDYFNCILVLECRSMFEEAYDKMVHSNVDVFINSNESDEDTLNKIILFYEHVYGKIIKECGKDQVLLRILDKEYLKIDFMKYADSIYSIHDVEMKKQNSHTKIVTLTTFINMINDTRAQDILLYDFQYRLMTNSYNYEFEKYYIECLNKTKYFSLVNKLNRCLRDVNLHKNYFVCQLEKYGEVDIEYRLLTNGFWMLSTQDIMINKTITMLENKIKDKLNDRLLDKVIGFNYTNSAIVIEFNGYEIQMSTLDYLVFDTVNNEREITIEKVNDILKCDSKASIKRLQENLLVICENDMYRTNREYNNGDLSIFGIELDELQCKKKPKCKHELVQTKILRILKNERKMTRDKIVNYMGEAYKRDFDEALEDLISKSEIICTGGMCMLNTEKD